MFSFYNPCCRRAHGTYWKQLEVSLSVYEQKELAISNKTLKTYCSPTAEPSEIDVDAKKSVYWIIASGSDFFHAEDSYAAIFADNVKGDFMATVKITAFGERTHEVPFRTLCAKRHHKKF